MRHPNIIARPFCDSVLIYSADAYIRQWMERELAETGVGIQVANKLDHVLAALIDDPPPRPQTLVIDIDTTRRIELARLAPAVAGTWRGRLIGIGERFVDLPLDHQIAPPYRTGDLRAVLRDRLPARGSTPHQHRTQRVAISSLRDLLG